jgi:hypothetical protein
MRVTIGDAKFEADGEHDAVAQDYATWIGEIKRQERRKITDAIARLETELRYERRRLAEFDKPATK